MSDNPLPIKPDEQESGSRNTIGREIDLFVRQIDSLAETLPLTSLAIQGASESSREQFVKFLADVCEPVIQDDKTTYTLDSGKYLQYRRLAGRFQKTLLAHDLVPRSFLVSLVSQFDAFLGRLIRQLFRIRPEILNSSTNSLTFSQLAAFGSIDNAREYVIDKEIEMVLRKSHSEQFDWLEAKFGLPLRVNLKAWPVFIEVTERRNLFVHTSGVVSHQYLEVCNRHCSVVDENMCPGKTLAVTPRYFGAAHECLFEIGVKLAQVLWRKLTPDDIGAADQSLSKVSYELLSEGRYQLARVLLDFATETLKKHGSEENRLVMVVNRAQAYKWSGDEDAARKIINSEDWSATEAKFRLGQAVILDDFATAIKIIRQIGPDGAVNKHFYRDWPLFKKIRESKEFAAVFEEIFGEPFKTVTINPEDAAAASKEIIH